MADAEATLVRMVEILGCGGTECFSARNDPFGDYAREALEVARAYFEEGTDGEC